MTTLQEVTTTLQKVTTTLQEVTTTLQEVTTTLQEGTTTLQEVMCQEEMKNYFKSLPCDRNPRPCDRKSWPYDRTHNHVTDHVTRMTISRMVERNTYNFKKIWMWTWTLCIWHSRDIIMKMINHNTNLPEYVHATKYININFIFGRVACNQTDY